MIPTVEIIFTWFQNNTIRGIGIVFIVAGLILTFSELRVYLRHESTTEQLVFWSMVLVAGIFTTAFNDIVLGILLGISILMIVETIKMWDTPVWGKLMAATTASYLVILFGKIAQMAYDYVVQPAETNDQILSIAFNIAFYVFIGVAFFFFGKKFILVSRFSSPQMVYLFLFGVLYIFIARFFPRDPETNFVLSFNYLGLGEWSNYIIFANFGTYEALVLVMVFMYFISGWLLTLLMGVEPVTDPVILEKVQEVARTMGIKEEVKVGFVRAPILNAFAYGPWFDKRIAFIANDLDEFSDSDIRGVIGHELAHAANHHVLLLLLLSIFELGIKKGLGIPASTLDYSFIPDTAVLNVSFEWYYVISYGLLIVLLVFVRILEGHADKKTKEAGYAKDLSQALYRLEGFYNGVASDFGISVNLLTDRTYSIHEKRRFTAQAGRNLFTELVSPTRSSALANIFQSHPRTSYRIASLVVDEKNPMKAAFLPYRLLGFGFRKGAMKELGALKDPYHEVLDETYLRDYGNGALNEVMNFNPWKEPYFDLIGKQVIAYNKFSKAVVIGKFSAIKETDRVTSPIQALVDDKKIDLSINVVKEYYPEESYILKNGDIVTLLGYDLDEKKGCQILSDKDGKEFKIDLPLLGKPTRYLKDLVDKEVLIYQKGTSTIAALENILFGTNFRDSALILSGKEYTGKQLIVGFPPLGFEVRKEKIELQLPLLEYLVDKKVLLYTKENFDVSLAGRLIEVNQDHIVLEDADGSHNIALDELEYMMFAEPTVEFINREHVSLFTKFGIWWSNRKEFNYIF